MFSGGVRFNFLEQTLWLLPQKAIFWVEQQALIVADVHLGKVGHFRKAGIAIPEKLAQDDLATLSDLIRALNPAQLIFLGDLFHSELNADWEWFAMWRQQFPDLNISLIKGNHDIIPERKFAELHITFDEQLALGPFLMMHHPLKSRHSNAYVLCGHIHPGVKLKSKTRQTLTLPCFAFGDFQAILPSFGKFTGRVAIRHLETDRIFAVLEHKVMAL